MSKTKEPITFGKTADQKKSQPVTLPKINGGKRLKYVWLGILGLLLLCGLVLIGKWEFDNYRQQRVDKAIETGTKLAEEAKPQGAVEEAQAQAWKGDVGGADGKLQAAIAAATTNEEKHQLMVQRALLFVNSGQPQQALTIIAEAEKLGSTKASSDAGAYAAEDAKNRPLAIEYYNKSLERLDKSNPLYESEKREILKKIEELKR